MGFFKQLICDHIWDDIETKHLGKVRKKDGASSFGLPTYSNYRRVAITKKCIKCDATRVVEQHIWLI